MTAAYVDTSCLVAIALGEPGADRTARRLRACDRLLASNLLEAELTSVLRREDVQMDEALTSWITWIHPNRSLTTEYRKILSHGHLGGADLWHLACALFLVPSPAQIGFFTLDQRQNEVAAALGFETL